MNETPQISIPEMPKFSPNVIVVDANYADAIAYDFKVNVALQVKRELPDVDLATFVLCCALDGELEQNKENEVMVLMVCHKGETVLNHMAPARLMEELNDKAFMEQGLGEFAFSVVEEPEEDWLGGTSLFTQVCHVALASPDVKRVICVGDWENEGAKLEPFIKEAREVDLKFDRQPKHVTVITAQNDLDEEAYSIRHMGYAIMHCLGVTIEELRGKD